MVPKRIGPLDESRRKNSLAFSKSFFLIRVARSAIQWAVYTGHIEITHLLINFGADGEHVNTEGSTLFHFLLEGARGHLHRPKLSQFLLLLGDERLVIDLETEDFGGYSALDLAASWYPAEVIHRLLALGASMAKFGGHPWSHQEPHMVRDPLWQLLIL